MHGDFRLGNLIVGPDGVRAVLDWELAHLGDPLEDLGWLCVKAWRFGVAAARSAGSGPTTSSSTAYEAAGGGPVDRDALRWWEVLGTLKWGIICIMQAVGPHVAARSARWSWPPSAGGSARTSGTSWRAAASEAVTAPTTFPTRPRSSRRCGTSSNATC